MSSTAAARPLDDLETGLLLRFLRERDVRCPRCDYNLRNLTQPVCPECREALHLAVGLVRPRLHMLILAMAPGMFCGISAFFLLGMITMASLSPRGRVPWQPFAMDIFGWLSAAFAVALFLQRDRVLTWSGRAQLSLVAVVWFVHIAFLFMICVLR